MWRGLMRAVAVLTLVGGLSAPALAQDEPTLIVSVTTDDVWSGQMALGFAQTMLDDGANVVVVLNVRAVALANTAVPQHTEALIGKTPPEMIAGIIDSGGRVFICPSCTRQAGLDIEQRVEGTEPGGPAYREIVMAPGTRIISF